MTKRAIALAGETPAALQDALGAQLEARDIPAVWRTLHALPHAIRAEAPPVDDARRILSTCLGRVTEDLAELDAGQSLRRTLPAITGRLQRCASLDDLLGDFPMLLDALRPTFGWAQLNVAYEDKELTSRLLAHAGRRLRGTDRSPMGVVDEVFTEFLQRARRIGSRRRKKKKRGRSKEARAIWSFPDDAELEKTLKSRIDTKARSRSRKTFRRTKLSAPLADVPEPRTKGSQEASLLFEEVLAVLPRLSPGTGKSSCVCAWGSASTKSRQSSGSIEIPSVPISSVPSPSSGDCSDCRRIRTCEIPRRKRRCEGR